MKVPTLSRAATPSFGKRHALLGRMQMGAGMNPARKVIAPQRKPGDVVPESGIYYVLHSRCTSDIREATFVAGQQLPPCRVCGSRVRFQLKQAIPHISEDRDFKK